MVILHGVTRYTHHCYIVLLFLKINSNTEIPAAMTDFDIEDILRSFDAGIESNCSSSFKPYESTSDFHISYSVQATKTINPQICQTTVIESATTECEVKKTKQIRSRLSAKKHRQKRLEEKSRLDEELSALETYIEQKTAENRTLGQDLEHLKFQLEQFFPGITSQY